MRGRAHRKAGLRFAWNKVPSFKINFLVVMGIYLVNLKFCI